jgi:spermidine/putrescine transport system permease protein
MTASRRLWFILLIPGALWLFVFFLLPFAQVIAASFGGQDLVGRPVYNALTPGNYGAVFQPLYIPVLARSLEYAVATTLLCLLIGYPVAYMIARFGGRYKTLLVILVVLPWFVDYLVRIYAWVVILGDQGVVNGLLHTIGIPGNPPVTFVNTDFAVVGGLVYDYLPFMILPIFAALERLDPSVIEAGKDLYGKPAQTFWHVTWPATFPGVLAGAILVGLPAVGDFATATLLGGTNTYMIGNVIQDQFTGVANWPVGAAFTVVLMALLSLSLIVYLRSTAGGLQEYST